MKFGLEKSMADVEMPEFRDLRFGIPSVMLIRQPGPPPDPNREEHPYKASVNFQGILVWIESPKGSTRTGVGEDGKRWSVKMRHDYGEIPGTRGADGDPIDVYIGPNPLASTAFVVHQKNLVSTAEAQEGVYDEDKIMLGFDTEEAAVRAWAAHFDRPVFRPGVTAMPVSELRARLYNDELEDGAAIMKAGPPGAGWIPIVGGEHGGYKKPAPGKKRWTYWYPDEPTHAPKMERDPSRTSETVKPGDIVEVGGRSGLYRFTPGHEHEEGPPPAGSVWVTHLGTGAHEAVRRSTLYPMRPEQPKPKSMKVPPPPPPKPGKASPPGTVQIGTWTGPVSGPLPKPGPATDEPAAGARMAKVYADSEAKPGTMLHDLEHGVFQLQKIREAGPGERWRTGVYVPPEKRDALVKEFAKEISSTVRKYAKRFHLPLQGPNGERSEHHAQLTAGGHLGLVMALSNYQGGKPFLAVARRYIQLYVLREARQEMGATSIPDRTMRALGTFVAAQHQAANKANGGTPSPQAIADKWVLKKKHVAHTDLGRYRADNGDLVDQNEEEVPHEPWRVRAPDGAEMGAPRPGKLALVETYQQLISGGKVKDTEWLQQHESEVLAPTVGMPVGTALHLRMEVESLLKKLPAKYSKVLELKFGLHDGSGEEAPAPVIAKELGLEGSEATIRRQVRQLTEEATRAMKAVAQREGAEVARHIERWTHEGPRAELGSFTAAGPSHRELAERFGGDRAVAQYHAAVRAGQGNVVEPILIAAKEGKASPEELARVQKIVHEQQDQDRVNAWKQFYRTRVVGPEAVRDVGPVGPAYDTSAHDYMVTLAKRGGTH